MDIRVGTIREVKVIPETDKLLCCQVDFGSSFASGLAIVGEEERNSLVQIVSGIKEYYPDPSVLIGKQVLYIVNLERRIIKGYESNGMLLTVDGIDGRPVFLIPENEVPPGSRMR